MKALISLTALVAAVGLLAQAPALGHEEVPPPNGHEVPNGEEAAFIHCPAALQHVLDRQLEGFVAFIIDVENTQAKPIQCFDSGRTAENCDYLSNSDNPCDVTGLFGPQSIDIYESSITSCNTSGGSVKCNRIDFP